MAAQFRNIGEVCHLNDGVADSLAKDLVFKNYSR
jgi:hypothetical protein